MTPELEKALSDRYAIRKVRALSLDNEVMELTSHISSDISLVERVWLLKNGMLDVPHCPNGSSKKWVDGNVGYRFCGRPTSCQCARENHSAKISASKKAMTETDVLLANEKRKATVEKRYGVKHVGQVPEFREKIETTSLKRFGHRSNLVAQKDQIRSTNLDKYGYAFPMQNPTINARARQTLIDNGGSLFDKRAEFTIVMQERYGTDHALQNDSLKDKATVSNIKRFGFPHASQSPEVKQQIKNTCLSRYGVNHPRQRDLDYNDNDLMLTSDPLYFKSEYERLGIYGLLSTSNLSRAVVRNLLVSHGLDYDKNLTAPERMVADILDENDVEYRVRDRRVIAPLELDFYIPSLKLAIEVCGLFWHSEGSGKPRDYHLNKLRLCEKAGVRLLTIFDDELDKLSIVESRIKHALGLSIRRCGARQTTVKEISTKEATDFLLKHHVQGSCRSQIRFGAYHENCLVAVMTFGGLRRSLGQRDKKSGTWELLRFASAASIAGVASKLFKSFVSTYAPNEVISYCDKRWGQGGLYQQLGMTHISDTTPGYWYVSKNKRERHHRFKFTKGKLVKDGHDPALTEKLIMQNLGFDRIWDCGHSKWKWIVDK